MRDAANNGNIRGAARVSTGVRWIFTGRQRLTANELNRIDRIPKFVFSNASESGVTPDRSEQRSDRLAPAFAESFFARGVGNFVCTAWPVDDVAARSPGFATAVGTDHRREASRDGRWRDSREISVIGFEKLNFSVPDSDSLRVALETAPA